MVPELVIMAAVVMWTVVGSFRRLPRYVHWRGPREGTHEEAQREHLETFHDPSREADKEFES